MEKSLKLEIEHFLEMISLGKSELNSDSVSNVLFDLYSAIRTGICASNIYKFRIKSSSTETKLIETKIRSYHNLDCLKYIIYELVCNIEQHADVEFGYILLCQREDTLTIAIADGGISIYGSYIKNNKYVDLVANSDEQALNLAQKGYSTKNLPNAENRGYGLSTSSRLTVEGLHGEFAILSGNALFYRDINTKQIIALPEEILWQGTMVIINIPLNDEKIDIYKYIS